MLKLVRIALHGSALVVADLAGIGCGAVAAFRLVGVADQVWLQLPIAVVLSIGFFFAWMCTLRILRIGPLLPRGSNELGAYLLSSVVWGVLLFVPVHYFTQGYMTGVGNLMALVFYQLPVNAVALFGSAAMFRSIAGSGPSAR